MKYFFQAVLGCVLLTVIISLSSQETALAQQTEFLMKGATEPPLLTLAAHRQGNFVVVGKFRGSLQIADSYLERPTNADYYYLAKYDSAGKALWAIPFAGRTDSSWCSNVALDSFGNIYVAGWAIQSYNFGDSVVHSASRLGFIAKFDPNGVYRWLRLTQSTTEIGPASIFLPPPIPMTPPPPPRHVGVDGGNRMLGTDTLENVYVACNGRYIEQLETFEVTGYDFYANNYIIKLTNRGKFAWAKLLSGEDTLSIAQYVVSPNGDSYVLASSLWPQLLHLGVPSPTPIGGSDIILLKLSAKGDLLWAKSFGSTANDSAMSMGIDGRGNLYISGIYSADFNLGTTPLKAKSGINYFVAKLDPNANPIWARSWNAAGASKTAYQFLYPNYINVDRFGDVYSATNFSGSITFDTTTYAAKGQNDLFLSKLDPNGKTIWKMRAGASGDELVTTAAINGYGDLYLAGRFTNSFSLNSSQIFGGNDAGFIAKIKQPTIITDSLTVRHCAGDSILVNYKNSGELSSPYIVQLSDSGGFFHDPVEIGRTTTTVTNGVIKCALPESLLTGETYTLRILTLPVDSIGLRNGPVFGIDSLPSLKVTNNKPLSFCEGGSVVLTASGGQFVKWSTGDTTRRVELSKAGLYYVAASSLAGCEKRDSVRITVFPLPQAKILEGDAIHLCQGDSIKLTAKGGSQYLWSTNDTTSSILVKTSGFYSVTVIDQNGCTDVAATKVTVTPRPARPQITKEGSILISSSDFNNSWSKDGFIIEGATLKQYNTFGKPGKYTVIVTDSNGCSSISDIVEIIENNAVRTLPASALSLTVTPNPLRARTAITITTKEVLPIRIEVIDLLGVERGVLYNGLSTIGEQTFHLEPNSMQLHTGTYYIRAITPNATLSRRIEVIK